jgi:rare lipoprotein A (peptidoglycan hydrolase)
VRNQENGKTVICRIRDLGPWNTDDYAYVFGDDRPQAESGTDKKGRETNSAGIDLTPAAAAAIGLEGKGMVSWRFVEPQKQEEVA